MQDIDDRIEAALGLDVAKDTVTLHDLVTGQTLEIVNREEALMAALEPFADRRLAVCEATGGHEDALLRALVTLGVPVHRGDGAKIKHFARSLGRAKTDALDARMLALYARERGARLARWTPPSGHAEELADLVARRGQLVRMRQGERTRAAGPRGPRGRAGALAASFEAIARALDEQIAALEERIRALVRADPDLAERKRVVSTIEGVGEVTAVTLVARMPELGHLNRRQAASLVGCAPHPQDSGKFKGRRRACGGRRHLKALLFTAAMAAARGDNRFAAFFKRLVASGKSKRCAYTALARKLVVVANARLAEHHAPNTQLT